MPKVEGQWEFPIVRAFMTVDEETKFRPALELFVLDEERSLLAPISCSVESYKPGLHLMIDKQDPAFIHTRLDPDEQSYIMNNEAKPVKKIVFGPTKGKLVGALAEKFVIWSGRGDDQRLARGHNPPQVQLADYMPWYDNEPLYRRLVIKNSRTNIGYAEYNAKSKKIVVSSRMWPAWGWWVYTRAQQLWDTSLTKTEKQQWMDSCRKHQDYAMMLLNFWIGVLRNKIDYSDASAQAKAIFSEACMLTYVLFDTEEMPKPMALLLLQISQDDFWRIAE